MTSVYLLTYGEDEDAKGETVNRIFASREAAVAALVAHLESLGAADRDCAITDENDGWLETDEGDLHWSISYLPVE